MWEWIKKLVEQPPLSTDGQLFPGVEKPTVTLAHMLVQEMFTNVNPRLYDANAFKRHRSCEAGNFPRLAFAAEFKRKEYSFDPPDHWDIHDCTFKDDQLLTFDKHEREILLAGFLKWRTLVIAAKKNEAETKRQQRALDSIEKQLKGKEPVSDGNVHEALRPPDSSGQAQSIIAPENPIFGI